MFAPQLGHGLRVHQLEDALLPLGPLDVPGTGVFVLEKVQQELPQVGGASCWKMSLFNAKYTSSAAVYTVTRQKICVCCHKQTVIYLFLLVVSS